MSYLFAAPPWSVVTTGDTVNVTSGIYNVCEVYEVPDEDGYTELSQESNASLIAAAPEMYALLERITLVKDLEKLEEYKERVRKLFLRMGVTVTQYHLRELARKEETKQIAEAKKRLDKEVSLEAEENILQSYFGDNWSDYELYEADVGYCAFGRLGTRCAKEKWYIFAYDGTNPNPYYFDKFAWFPDAGKVAYVYPIRKGQDMVEYQEGTWYKFDEIVDLFKAVFGSNPDMEKVKALVKGQSIQEIIDEYKEKYSG